MSDQISRRDFLNGTLLASGGFLVSQSIPLKLFAASMKADSCDGDIGSDPRAIRGGNLPSAFRVAHWLRDRRLSFEGDVVKLTAGCDPQEGKFQVNEDPDKYDVVIVGAGISGLSTAFYLQRRRPGTRILILDANAHFGGNAGRDDQKPIPVVASTAGSYLIAPYADYQKELFGGVGLDWERYKIQAPMYNYFFDDRTPGVKKGHRGWNIDSYGAGVKNIPYSPEIVQQLIRVKAEFSKWSEKKGSPTDPADASDPKYDRLSTISLHDYLVKELRCDPIVSDFYTRYTIDALAGTCEQVNAHSSISFLGAEYGNVFAFPGGTSGLARMLVQHLIKDAVGEKHEQILSDPVRWEKLDRSDQKNRIRLNSTVVRADQGSVTYHKDGKFHRVRGKAIVLAGQAHTAQHLVGHLIDDRRKSAWAKMKTVPVVVANVAIKSAAPLVDAGFGYNQYWWGSKYWADFVTADWAMPQRMKRDRPTVLTFFGGNLTPPEELAGERYKLMTTPFSSYEASLKEDMSRIMAGMKFDFERDVTAIYLYRWGHGMTLPSPGLPFGESIGGKIDRNRAPRRIACAQLGKISFAGQDSEGTPSVESAMASGLRAAKETITQL